MTFLRFLKTDTKRKAVIIIAATLLATAAGTIVYLRSRPQPEENGAELSEEDKIFIEEASPMVDAFFTGFAEDDYNKAAAYFNDVMREEMTIGVFESAQSQISEKIGDLVSLDEPEVSERGESKILTYTAKYEEEDEVKIEFVFGKESEGGWRITGIWFDSPKLRQ